MQKNHKYKSGVNSKKNPERPEQTAPGEYTTSVKYTPMRASGEDLISFGASLGLLLLHNLLFKGSKLFFQPPLHGRTLTFLQKSLT